MANNNFVVNAAQFTPLSFDDYVKPLAMLNEQHQKLDDAYLELYTKASTVEQMANEQTDPEAYKQYKNYANDLRSAIDVLDKNGLTPNSRRQMLLMARRYGDEVAPIQTAYGRRAQDIMAQREALSKDQSIRFSRKASDSSLMDYMNDPALSYEQFSGATITADVASKVKNLKNQILKGGVGAWSKTLGGQQFERMVRSGLTTEDIADIMANPTKYPEFTNLINSAVLSSGVGEWGSPEDIAYATQRAYDGLWEGIGTDKLESVENKDLDRAYKSMQIARLRDEMENPEKYGHKNTSKSGNGEDGINGRHFITQKGALSPNESKRVKTHADDLKFVQGLTTDESKLKNKDRQKLEQIARTYGVSPTVDDNGNIDYTNLINVMAANSGERYRNWYMSNLTDSSTLLSNMGFEIANQFNGEDVSDKDMDLLFTPTKKSWADIKVGKSNGVELTKMDVLNDIMHSKDSRITLDPMSGRLMVQQTVKPELGNIILYDIERDGGTPRILGGQNFYGNYGGVETRDNLATLMAKIQELTWHDYLYDSNTSPLLGLVESLFSGLTAANNAVTMSHGSSSDKANVYIPTP